MRKMLLCLLCSLLVSTTTYATNVAELPFYYYETYDSFTGLPTSEANDIHQTADGQIWIASYGGLIRYDGRSFYNYGEQGFSSVLCLYEDSKERLWIGTNNDGVLLYDNNTFTYVTENIEIPSFSTRALAETSDGAMLVGTALGLYTISPDFSVEVIEDPRLTDVFISELINFGENQCFGLTKAGDMFILQDREVTTFISHEEFPYDTPLYVLPMTDEQGDYFLVGMDEEYLLEMRESASGIYTYHTIATEGLYHINALLEDSQGRIWIVSDGGLGLLDYQKREVTNLSYLTVSSFGSICEDQEGNFWLTSTKEGVLKLAVSQFRNISSGLMDFNQVNGVEILDGLIYIVSPNGINIIDSKTSTLVENVLTETYEGEYFRCVEKDNVGNIWFSSYTEDRLIKYTPSTETITPITEENGLDTSRIRSTMVAKDGSIWVATGNGVYVVQGEQVIAHYGSDDGMKNVEILTMSEDLDGRVFVGTDGAGIYIIENGSITKQIDRNEGLRSDIILRTESDSVTGGTWIVTGNSIYYYLPETDELQLIEDFPYSNNFDLLFYEENIIVLSSNGLYFTTRASMLGEEPFQYIFKNYLDGLFSTPVANSFSKVENGVLYLCGYQNLTSFDMKENVSHTSYIPKIDVPKILVNNQPIYPSGFQSYQLPSTANYMELEILIPTYSLQDYNVSFYLSGYDGYVHTNSYPTFLNPTYTNLPGGSYVFQIKVMDARTGELVSEEEFSIVKEYTLLENPIVRGCMIFLGIVLLVVSYYIIAHRRILKLEAQKKQARNMLQDIIELLSKIIEAKDRYTTGHSTRVAYYARAIAKAMEFNQEEEESVYGIALLHDVGKVSVPDEVLNKAGCLTPEEFDIMKQHPVNGSDILESIHSWPDLTLGAKFHHERYDGTGYPDKLRGEEIPLIARIICIADAFDAMYSSRVYRKKMELTDVLAELENNSGTQFDPKIVPIFVELVRTGELDELLAELDPK